MTSYGALYWGFNAHGCFLWAKVLKNGRVFIEADYKFIHMPVEAVAKEIKSRTSAMGIERLHAVYALPETFPAPSQKERGTLEAEAPSQTFARFGLPLVSSGGHRQHGWQRVHDFLRDAPDGKPWLVVSPECKWLPRTLPTLVQTKTDPDDCEGDEYAANALRALLSSRPQPSSVPKKPTKYEFLTLGWLKQTDNGSKRRGAMSRR